MEVVVTGGRDFDDRVQVFRVLDGMLGSVTLLIQGGALGADTYALEWAISRKIPHKTYDAEWTKYGRREAGRKRNRLMLFKHQTATVVAFKGGTGTAHCVETAKQLNMKVIVIKANT